MKRKKLLLLPILFTFSGILYGQQWAGSADTSSSILRSGNVSIGTSTVRTSDRALDIDGHVVIAGNKISGDLVDIVNTNDNLVHGSDVLWLAITHSQTENPKMLTVSSADPDNIPQKFTIRYNGNVGIGVVDPLYRLDVKGAISSTNGESHFSSGNYADPVVGTSFGLKIGSGGLAVNGSSVFKDNVGIGIVSPTEKLSVNGNIRAKEIKVEATNWPDYVFQPSYGLPSLETIGKYIADHGHLPNIPTAKEIARDGLSLGEMNKKLLEKVEELTLLLIQQNNAVEKQGILLDSLQKEVQRLTKKVTD